MTRLELPRVIYIYINGEDDMLTMTTFEMSGR